MAGYDFTLSACEGPGPEHYAAVLLNDPDLEELLGTEAWLRGAPVSQVSRPVHHASAQHGAFRRPDPACECSPRRPHHRLIALAQHASAQHGAFPSQVAEFVNSQPSAPPPWPSMRVLTSALSLRRWPSSSTLSRRAPPPCPPCLLGSAVTRSARLRTISGSRSR
jgi:hypothetical protein